MCIRDRLGSGRTETAEVIFGIKPADSGTAWIKGKAQGLRSPHQADVYKRQALDTEGVGDSSQVVVSGYVLPGLQVKYGVGIFDSCLLYTSRCV